MEILFCLWIYIEARLNFASKLHESSLVDSSLRMSSSVQLYGCAFVSVNSD